MPTHKLHLKASARAKAVLFTVMLRYTNQVVILTYRITGRGDLCRIYRVTRIVVGPYFGILGSAPLRIIMTSTIMEDNILKGLRIISANNKDLGLRVIC